jgi:hypothetical protein
MKNTLSSRTIYFFLSRVQRSRKGKEGLWVVLPVVAGHEYYISYVNFAVGYA